MSARSTRTNLSLLRTAGVVTVATLGALGVTGAFASTAGALTPAPQPTLPIAQADPQPEPPVGPMIITLPSDDGPDLDGPDGIAQPMPGPDPHPAPHPQGPTDLTTPEDEPGWGGPDDFTTPEDDPGFGGPDDFTTPEDDPGFGGPDDFTGGGGGPVDPEPEPEVETDAETPDPTGPDAEVLEETASTDPAAATELAFTGGDLDLLTGGLALLGAGGLVTGVTVLRRRRSVRV